jgi:hypothetical protein
MTFLDWVYYLGEVAERASGRKPVPKKDGALRFGILGAASIA